MKNDTKVVVEEWLNELIEELYPETKKKLVRALKENSLDELNRDEEFLFTFIKEYEINYKDLPANIVK